MCSQYGRPHEETPSCKKKTPSIILLISSVILLMYFSKILWKFDLNLHFNIHFTASLHITRVVQKQRPKLSKNMQFGAVAAIYMAKNYDKNLITCDFLFYNSTADIKCIYISVITQINVLFQKPNVSYLIFTF